MKPKIALVGAGGTISTRSNLGPMDFVNYMVHGTRLSAAELVEAVPQVREVAEIVPVEVRTAPSTSMGIADWCRIARAIDDAAAAQPQLDGFVVLHGTGTLEETAYFLQLALKTDKPVVVTGSQRPLGALSSDSPLNFINAVRVAADPQARGMGVMVCLNDEINPARDVTKGATSRLQAFRVADFGMLGEVADGTVHFYRRPLRTRDPDSGFSIDRLAPPPRVDIAYTYAGEDGTVVRALVDAGAQGLVMAAFPGGRLSPGQKQACIAACQQGVVVAISSRCSSGRAYLAEDLATEGILSADNLNPQKARILLMFALSVTRERAEIGRLFARH